MTSQQKIKVQKYKLNNGLTILINPIKQIPRVDIQLWYNVGSKDEKDNEKGMAHLIEHMIFKGSKLFSESDINELIHKLCGYTNAFTSYDYTSYVFRLPSNCWKHSFTLLAECMRNCRFDEQMLYSELKAVISEMKMYKDDYPNVLIEGMCSSIFEEHPYHHPIIGYKHDLWNLTRNNLHSFYKNHYHPGNATLVVVGDIEPSEVLNYAKQTFGAISPKQNYKKTEFFAQHDIKSKSLTIYRETDNPLYIFAYQIPGAKKQKIHIFEMISILLCGGKSSRLYEALVNKEQVAVEVEAFNYNLIDSDIFFISVSPKELESEKVIEDIINHEIEKIIKEGIEEWEMAKIKIKVEMDYLSILENSQTHASTIGSLFLATGDENFISKYLTLINETSELEIINALRQYFRPSIQNKGYLLPIDKDEIKFLDNIQEESDKEDEEILEAKERFTEVEPAKWSKNIAIPKPISFSYPKPVTNILSNQICLMWHHNPFIPKISIEIEFKANYLYEDKELAGLSLLHSRLLLEGTKKISSKEFHQLLESRGISLFTQSGSLSMEFLDSELHLALDILHELFLDPLFDPMALEKIRAQMIVELKEYWDTPIKFINQLAKDLIYKSHPYSKPVLGTLESLKRITVEDVWNYHKKYITPKETNISIVGDLTIYDKGRALAEIVQKYLGDWSGPSVEDLELGTINYEEPKIIEYEINRDQVVLGFASKSVSRTDELYDQLAILDVILMGGPNSSMNSRFFSLREQTGLFYTIGGSLICYADKAPGIVFIKTIVSNDKVETAKNEIQNLMKNLIYKGITEEEFLTAKNIISAAAIEHFETNSDIAKSFLFLKKFNFPFDLFDKRGAKLSIIDIGNIHQAAQQFCNPELLSIIKVGRQSN